MSVTNRNDIIEAITNGLQTHFDSLSTPLLSLVDDTLSSDNLMSASMLVVTAASSDYRQEVFNESIGTYSVQVFLFVALPDETHNMAVSHPEKLLNDIEFQTITWIQNNFNGELWTSLLTNGGSSIVESKTERSQIRYLTETINLLVTGKY